MEVLEITEQNFDKEVMQAAKPVLIDFWASWCGPCKMMSPIVDEIANEIGEKAIVGKVNVDEQENLARQFQIMSIPTLVIIKNGQVVKSFVGVQDKTTILAELA